MPSITDSGSVAYFFGVGLVVVALDEDRSGATPL